MNLREQSATTKVSGKRGKIIRNKLDDILQMTKKKVDHYFTITNKAKLKTVMNRVFHDKRICVICQICQIKESGNFQLIFADKSQTYLNMYSSKQPATLNCSKYVKHIIWMFLKYISKCGTRVVRISKQPGYNHWNHNPNPLRVLGNKK